VNPLVIIRVAVRALLRHKMRSFLTTLGIMIGVGAVIAMVAMGEGAKRQVEQQYAAMGTNLLVLSAGSTRGGGVQGGAGSAATLTWDDVDAIRALTSVHAVAPALRSSAPVVAEEQNWTTSVYGTSPEYFEIRTWPAATGSLFTASDVTAGAKVVVLGKTVAEKLFGDAESAVGQMVRIKQSPFQVVAVLSTKGQSQQGQDNDDAAFVPVSAFRTKIQGGLQKYVSGQVYIGAASADETTKAQTDITALLRDRHHLDSSAADDFSLRNLAEFASARAESTRTLTLLLAGIAAVSLLVGGIGIMNIMLVSVTERTREIGLRMAIGAKPGHIMAQFLVESLVLSVAGGIIGIGLGIVAGQRLAVEFGWPMLLRADVIILAVGFSAVVGVGFGLYPAYQASRLDPIQALRYE
jgi:putative ABC transport system permease protein